MKKLTHIAFVVVSLVVAFFIGYIVGEYKGCEKERKRVMFEIYQLHNVKKMSMNESLAVVGMGDEGLRMVWE